jgi:prevent-host-death family protein
MEIVSLPQATNRFGSLLNTLQEGNPITITRKNRNVAILISPLDFQLLGGEKYLLEQRTKYLEQNRTELKKDLEAIQEEAEKNGLTQEILNDIINDTK